MGSPAARGRKAVVLLLAVSIFLLAPQAFGLIEKGAKYIPFKGRDIDGKEVNIEDYVGKKVILLKFGSIYCSTCVTSLKKISDFIDRVGSDKLQVIGINLDVYGIYRVRRFYRGYRRYLKFPMIIDQKLEISRPYRVQSLPSHVVIDRKGIVRYAAVGGTDEDLKELEDVLEKLIQGREEMIIPERERPLEVYLPQNFTKTLQESIYVVGETPYRGAEVTLTLNGGSKQTLHAMKNLFYIRTPLSLGSNYLEIQLALPDGRKVQQGLVLFREPKIGFGIKSPFPEYRYHNETNEKPCRKCHDLNPPKQSEKGFLVATQFCLTCHKELGGTKFVHGPIPVGGCSPCHDFSSMPNKYEVIAYGQDLCFTCHEDKKAELIKEYLHGPVSAGACTVCHSPHGSNEKFQLRKYVGDLCTMCHTQLKAEMYRTAVHRPFQDGACTKCHNAHSSEYPKYFLKLPGMKLCLSCHEGKLANHKHPFGVPPKRPLDVELDEKGNLTCLSCHNPHATDDEKLLPQGGCAYCHNV
ncbi:MAG: hypothetical protein D6713_08740 [Deltaproteobacteria bacterium]|nr:MAG: hypothetical protein D6713_08740 [Deltaproteobacteria bacterium]